MKGRFKAYALGATLYMPVIHPRVPDYLSGYAACPAPSIVLCLEDALAESDVARGLTALRDLLRRPRGPGPLVFVRPRSLDMALELAGWDGMDRVAGLVAPKVVPATVRAWMTLAEEARLDIMPTLESPEFFDPARIAALRDAFDAHDRTRIAAIRLGGNDLLSALALRRQAGVTSWEGPLAWILSMASSMLGVAGYPVAAPVYDIIGDLETLRREVRQDVAAGFVSKTAIHPAQVPCIQQAFRPTGEEVAQARAILDRDARAVFQIGGVMCEPSTHSAWAERIMERAGVFGTALDGQASARLQGELSVGP